MEFMRGSQLYYSVLGVSTDASDDEIRRAYRKLAMQWHPDKWTRSPSLLGEAKQKFQQIQEAYSVLSDRRKRMMYDAGMYDVDDEDDEVEGFSNFLQEMVSLINDARKEDKYYSTEELQSMFWEMAQDFDTPEWNQQQWFSGSFYDSGNVSSSSCESSRNQRLNKSSFENQAPHHFCRREDNADVPLFCSLD